MSASIGLLQEAETRKLWIQCPHEDMHHLLPALVSPQTHCFKNKLKFCCGLGLGLFLFPKFLPLT